MLALICPLILVENFSTAVILFGVVFIMMFIGRVSIKRLGILAGSLILASDFGILEQSKQFLKIKCQKHLNRAYTWVARIDRFSQTSDGKYDKYEITDENRQVQHGRIAIARGVNFWCISGQ